MGETRRRNGGPGELWLREDPFCTACDGVPGLMNVDSLNWSWNKRRQLTSVISGMLAVMSSDLPTVGRELPSPHCKTMWFSTVDQPTLWRREVITAIAAFGVTDLN